MATRLETGNVKMNCPAYIKGRCGDCQKQHEALTTREWQKHVRINGCCSEPDFESRLLFRTSFGTLSFVEPDDWCDPYEKFGRNE